MALHIISCSAAVILGDTGTLKCPRTLFVWLLFSRNFDRHFQEWRHAHGMRCLGIPNTKHFHDITLIQDARDLYAKIKDSLNKEQWNAEDQEEYEDGEGNVLNRRTYEDLARQGLM